MAWIAAASVVISILILYRLEDLIDEYRFNVKFDDRWRDKRDRTPKQLRQIRAMKFRRPKE